MASYPSLYRQAGLVFTQPRGELVHTGAMGDAQRLVTFCGKLDYYSYRIDSRERHTGVARGNTVLFFRSPWQCPEKALF